MSDGGRRRRAPWLVAGSAVLVVLIALGILAGVVSSSRTTLARDPTALASIKLPTGGGSIANVVATVGPQQAERFVPVRVTGDPVVYPKGTLKAGETVTITVTVKRPGWISWLSGKTQRVTREITVPSTRLRDRFITLDRSGALQVHFTKPVRAISYGPSSADLRRETFTAARRVVTVPHVGSAGTLYVAGTVQTWERAAAASVSWFPTGTTATAIARPAVNATIQSATPITLTFSKPVSKVLGDHLPTVSPATAGSWHTVSSHEISFVPTGYGYGLGSKVSIGLPAGVRLAGGAQDGSSSTGTWTVPDGSTARLQQILAELGYLPMDVRYAATAPADTIAAQEAAAEDPPQATLSWTYGDTPSGLKSQWYGENRASELTLGALEMFQYTHGLDSTGYEDAETWKALFQAVVAHQRNTFGYTFVSVHEASSDESLFVWHSGKTVLSNIPVNTGAAGAATQLGTFAVFEHAPSVTMVGTNPDGSHYDDKDVKWVSYFNQGDALHYFYRGAYGYPQSNGCVEMDLSDAAAVYPYTPVGTIVQVHS